MTKVGYPLAKTLVNTPQEWSNMAQNWLGTGVIKGKLNELQVYADSTGMQVKVKTGQAFLQGHFFQSDAEEVLPIAEANSTNPRIDRIIVRMDWVNDSLDLAVLQGVPAVSPVAPALTRNSSRWEISLAQVRVNAAVSTIVPGDITDERFPTGFITPTLLNGWIPNSASYPCKFWKEGNTVHFRLAIGSGATGANNACMIFPAGYRPAETELQIGHVDNGGTSEDALFSISSIGNLQNIRTLPGNSLVILNGSFKAVN